ncbi:MAG: NPCBM/NEW2 domain-containing protein, partial [Planctomycetales bacterium]|nr:NPCBM/NEW2 domain-containing protein [Planctomycetales bacterium]
LILAAVSQAQPPVTKDGITLTLLSGETRPAKSIGIAGGKLTADGIAQSLPLDDLRQIRLAPSVPDAKPAVVLHLLGGGKIFAKTIAIDDGGQCQVETSLAGKLAIPLDQVRGIRLEPATASPEFDKALAAPNADQDRLFIKIEDKVDSTAGIFKLLSDKEFQFDLGGESRTLPRAKLFGIVVAQGSATDDPTKGLITLRDGSIIAGEIDSLAGGKLTAKLPGGSKVEIPQEALASIALRSTRLAFLSDLKPVEEEQRSIAFLDVPWQKDRSVQNRTLTLGAKTFEKGIGCHAECRLTFAADGKWDVLAAVIGIDAETMGKGDCIFSVLADGESVFTRRVKGTDAPQEILVEIPRAKKVTLLVEPGAGLDLGDHADWCDVRFIKNSK